MPVPYIPLAIANEFITKAIHSGGIHHMKLQKLCFFSYGWWLVWNENTTPLMTEGPEVWKHGPVFSSLYNSLSYVGSGRILTLQRNNPLKPEPRANDNDNVTSLIEWIWSRYGHLSGFELSAKTHEVGTPWQEEAASNNYRVPANHKIPDDLIKKYFINEAKQMDAVV